MIDGVKITHLNPREDNRGFFKEIIRSDGIRQISHSFMLSGVKKLGHLHKIQTDWWYLITGQLMVFLSKGDSNTAFLMPDGVIQIPPGVVHGCEALTDVNLLYMASHTYNPEDDLRWK